MHTAEEHRGGNKHADGSDELEDHTAALDGLELEETVLSSESAQSVYRAGAPSFDISGDAHGEAGGVRYDEWDGKRRRYLTDHCHVHVVTGAPDVAGGRSLAARVSREQRRAIASARASVLRVETALRWRSRQIDGQDLDVDAAVERATAIRAGHEGTQRVYIARRRSARELAVMVLLDASLSTDAWVDDRRVLDVERQAAAIVALALDGLVHELGIAAFSSDTHARCSFVELKRFDEDAARVFARLATLAPTGYTRIGPAIRHGSALLARCHAKKRVLLVLTDGKPSDRDRYEGSHGESDVRQAVREADRDHIDVLALGADPRAAPHLATMFGKQAVAGLTRPGDVAAAITSICARRLAR